jgi:DhnA family fructose-bisphosphate aldolase class Ia
MVSGKERRMRRLLAADGRTLIVAVDHSLTNGHVDGLADMRAVMRAIVSGGPDAVIAHRGTATRAMPIQRKTGLIIHLSGNSRLSSDSDLKTRVCDPETAAALGADAVSTHLTLGAGHKEDREAFTDLGRIANSCDRLGLPLLVMTYAKATAEDRIRAIFHAARIASELGADIVKVAHPGESQLLELAATLMVPVVIAGGEVNGHWNCFLNSASIVLASGIAGLCVGRRIFTHADPARATAALRAVVHGESAGSE